MKTLYLDCSMGAAGDMLSAALLELLPDPDEFVRKLNNVGIPEVTFIREKSVKCGICGTHMTVCIDGMEEGKADTSCQYHHGCHQHRSLRDIEAVINSLSLPSEIKANILDVYTIIAEAESTVHGVCVSEVHFHEVGTMDAIADITAVCMLIQELSPEKIIAAPINVGSGHVKCRHGILPVPAPATASILKNIPFYCSSIDGELCTPTGAALLKYFVSSFSHMPVMKVSSIGYGMGKKDFDTANCVRAMLGEQDITDGKKCDLQCRDIPDETICDLQCNIDDMTAEDVGFAMERLFNAGALDVFSTPAYMKKSRPAILLHVLCSIENREQLIRAIFKFTSTIGIRETICQRYILDRSISTISTKYGDIRCKQSEGYGTMHSKYEYDDISRIAREHGLSLSEVKDLIRSYLNS